jgi:hypothetical protein
MRMIRFLSTAALAAIVTTAAPLAAQQSTQTIAALLQRPADATRELAAGTTKSGALTDASPMLSDSSRAELWYFRGTAGQRVTVRLRSDDFDTFVHVGKQGAEEPAIQNDDADDDGVNSAAELTLPSDGVYVIIANAFDASGRGAYSVALEVREPAPGMSGPFTPASVTLRDAEPMQRLAIGQRFGSQIDVRDQTMDDGTPFELWYVQASAGDTLHFAVQSTEFPPAIHVGKQGSGSVYVEAADAARASVRFVARESGVYAIIVRSTRATATGSYILELSKAGAGHQH